MRKLIYYVATSIDGFIAGPDDDISGFSHKSSGVQKYLDDLQHFDTVLMGRKTYEFGYLFGLKPGDLAYSHMTHYIFSKTLKFESQDKNLHVCNLDIDLIKSLKNKSGSDIYVCGGGQFSGWLLKHELLDVLKIKLNPFILNHGIKLFEGTKKQYQLELLQNEKFDHGLQINTYKINYK